MADETPKVGEHGEEEEPEVKVKDRRLLSEEERSGETAAEKTEAPPEAEVEPEPQAAESEQEEPAGADTDADSGETSDEDLPEPTVDDLLAMCVSMLAAHAWQKIGLQASPHTGIIAKDLDQARVAIDSLEALIDQLADRVPPSDANELRGMLSNLRVNFVQQSSS